MFRVPIASLSDGLHQETFHPSADDLGLDADVFSDIDVEVTLDLSERRVLAAYTARASARLECDRTLDPFDQPVEGSHAVVFTTGAIPDDADDTFPLLADAQELDLTGSVHDTLLLALPLRRVSPAALAAELPTAFGAPDDDDDAPADDRWAALQALRRDDAGDDS